MQFSVAAPPRFSPSPPSVPPIAGAAIGAPARRPWRRSGVWKQYGPAGCLRADGPQLTSPVDGTVQQLTVHTVGGVVTPAQTLLVLVPSDSHLEIEAMVENRDIGFVIGFVHAGQEAQIKVDAFNFKRYGLIGGTVVNISRDAIARGKLA